MTYFQRGLANERLHHLDQVSTLHFSTYPPLYVCMYIYVCMYVCIYIFEGMLAEVYVFRSFNMLKSMYECIYLYVHTCVCKCVCVCMYVCNLNIIGLNNTGI
jgi:hypothetical protein